MNRFTFPALALIVCAAPSLGAFAHGFAGKRFFPATLATEDPFVADEFSLPTLARRNVGADGASETESSASLDYTKRITQDLGFSFGASYLRQQGGVGVQRGFDNLAAGLKYQFYKSEAHESIASIGVDWDIGGTGAKRIGAEDFSTLTPSIFFGKGLGGLPEGVKWLRPLAFTGSVGLAVPTRTRTVTIDDDGNVDAERNPDALHVGLAIEYSIPYLQSFVKDIGLREPFNRVIPLVEFDLEKPVGRGSGPWTGTVNPGLLWTGRYVQLGIEAVVPVNSRTGGKAGVLLQLHFFLDDLFPHGIGKPLL